MASDILTKVQGLQMEYQDQERAINYSPDLTSEAKQRKIQDLRRRIIAQFPSLLNAIRGDVEGLTRRYNQAQARKLAAQEAEAARWDYQRLAYAGEKVRALVLSATLTEILDAWAAAPRDDTTVKAWAEVGAPSISARFGSEAAALLSDLKERAQALGNTPELAAAQADFDTLANDAASLHDAAAAVTAFYQNWTPNAYQAVSAVDSAFELRMNPQTLAYKISLRQPAPNVLELA